jgi:FlaA1/EpsC-like NDP-sugar epimerase
MANGAVYARPSILFVCLVSSVLSAVLVLIVLHASGSLQSPGSSSLSNISAIVEREVHMRTTRAIDTNSVAIARGDKEFRPVNVLAEHSRKRILVTGGAGFVGSHLVDRLMEQGHEGNFTHLLIYSPEVGQVGIAECVREVHERNTEMYL